MTTKIYALVNASGLTLTPGQTHDGKGTTMLLRDLKEGRVVLADKACDADWIRKRTEAQGAAPNIPDKINRKHRHCFSHSLYRECNRVERFFNKTKHFHRGATRYEKLAANYLAMIKLAATYIWVALMSPWPS